MGRFAFPYHLSSPHPHLPSSDVVLLFHIARPFPHPPPLTHSRSKSSLLKALTNANPEIASYPFTTLVPNLGVAPGLRRATLADLPGLIDGAHVGKGLGRIFLRHLRRARVILHVVDASLEDPAADYRVIRDELRMYNPEYVERPHVGEMRVGWRLRLWLWVAGGGGRWGVALFIDLRGGHLLCWSGGAYILLLWLNCFAQECAGAANGTGAPLVRSMSK